MLVADISREHGESFEGVRRGIVDSILAARSAEVGDVAADAPAAGEREEGAVPIWAQR